MSSVLHDRKDGIFNWLGMQQFNLWDMAPTTHEPVTCSAPIGLFTPRIFGLHQWEQTAILPLLMDVWPLQTNTTEFKFSPSLSLRLYISPRSRSFGRIEYLPSSSIFGWLYFEEIYIINGVRLD